MGQMLMEAYDQLNQKKSLKQKSLKRQKFNNEYCVHHIHLKFGDEIFTVEHRDAFADFEEVLISLQKIYFDIKKDEK